MRRPSDGFVYLRDSNTQGVADKSYFNGNPGDIPFAGDFGGEPTYSVSLYRPSNQTFYIWNTNSTGVADESFVLGNARSIPLAGDFGLGSGDH